MRPGGVRYAGARAGGSCAPVYITKQQLDTYAVELVREAEIAGRVGTETTRRAAALTDSTGLDPDIRWSTTDASSSMTRSP